MLVLLTMESMVAQYSKGRIMHDQASTAMQASMPSPTGLQQLVEAAGGMAAENKENASRKRGRELSESIPPPQKQVRPDDERAELSCAEHAGESLGSTSALQVTQGCGKCCL